MKVTFEFVEAIPIDEWNKAQEDNTLVNLVENCGWTAVAEAYERGYKQPISNISIDVIPDFSEDIKEQRVKTVIEYGSLL